jgi:hypothetical protein
MELLIKTLSGKGVSTQTVSIPDATFTQAMSVRASVLTTVKPSLQLDSKGYANLPAAATAKLTSQESATAAVLIKGANLLKALSSRDWNTVIELMPAVTEPARTAVPVAARDYVLATHTSSTPSIGAQEPGTTSQTHVPSYAGDGSVAVAATAGATAASGVLDGPNSCATMLSDIENDALEAQQCANTVSNDVQSAADTVSQWLSVSNLTSAQYSQMMSAAQAGQSSLTSAANAAQSAGACAADAATQYSNAQAAKCSSAILSQMETLLQQTQTANQTAQNLYGWPYIFAYQGIQQLLSTPQPAPSPASAPPGSCFQNVSMASLLDLSDPGEIDIALSEACTEDILNFFTGNGAGSVIVSAITLAVGVAAPWIAKLLVAILAADLGELVTDIKDNDTNKTGVTLHFSPFAWFAYSGLIGDAVTEALVNSGIGSGNYWYTTLWATANPAA